MCNMEISIKMKTIIAVTIIDFNCFQMFTKEIKIKKGSTNLSKIHLNKKSFDYRNQKVNSSKFVNVDTHKIQKSKPIKS